MDHGRLWQCETNVFLSVILYPYLIQRTCTPLTGYVHYLCDQKADVLGACKQ